MKDEALREALAALAHAQWAGWMRYLFSKCKPVDDTTPPGAHSAWILPGWAAERWQRQVATPYAHLPEEEKESDRKEADRVLSLLEIWKAVPE